ncbi:hypothetical protein FOPG_07435 [Fusarium oxysporum f. sp. conglutinans race 2 54008]|uniref:Uncharacterized protein n=1 Tax=Fusarium oxysporum f. sp. conglutinans race 2 54008 TaxID=1089457 RepID=X0I2V5_FUSOX|nr:hypothetical protein FOPG_07435 [Fusarium oxysporum f. sp. conglutinans race 2 54008]
MSSITNPRKYTIAFKFLETDTIQGNQIAAGNNLFKPIRQNFFIKMAFLQNLNFSSGQSSRRPRRA